MNKILWDLPTRIFHWALVLLMVLAWWSGEEENYDLHQWVGYLAIALVLSRIVWGFIGSTHSRFSDFMVGPSGLARYLRGEGADSPGHNPLGGWSILVMILLILAQGVSGLFNADDVLFSGPLYYAADSGFRDAMGAYHEIGFNVLMGFVLLHLLAVGYYQFLRGEKLLQAMISGRAEGREGNGRLAPAWLFLVIFLLLLGALWWGLQQAPQPQPMW